MYDALSRGDRREAVFEDDAGRERFREALEKLGVKMPWHVRTVWLKGKPVHLVVETPHGNLVAGMKWWLGEEKDVPGRSGWCGRS